MTPPATIALLPLPPYPLLPPSTDHSRQAKDVLSRCFYLLFALSLFPSHPFPSASIPHGSHMKGILHLRHLREIQGKIWEDLGLRASFTLSALRMSPPPKNPNPTL